MRALSVRQPWAELIARGKKKVEYRSWKRDFRGDLLIVASATRNDQECWEEGLDPEQLTYGAAVCVVDFWKVTGEEPEWSWHLRDVRHVEPIPVKGYASIYHVDDTRLAFVKQPVRAKRAAVTDGGQKSRRPPLRAPEPLGGRPKVVIVTPDPKMAERWRTVLEAMGCVVRSFRDGYSAWGHLDGTKARCVVLDEGIQGYPVRQVIALMRDDRAHATTPVVVVVDRRHSTPVDSVLAVARKDGSHALARAVRDAILDREA